MKETSEKLLDSNHIFLLKSTMHIFFWSLSLCLLFSSNFCFFTKWWPFKNYEKCILFHLKSSFRFRDIQIFVFPFIFVGHCFGGWRKINLKVHDVINCLNRNSITHFVSYLGKEKRYIETLFIDEVSDKEHFYRKIMHKMCSKS